MDPDVCLKELMELNLDVQAFLDKYGDDWDTEVEEPEEMQQFSNNVSGLVDHVNALHGWLLAGGFLPERWKNAKLRDTQPG
jgi:hypothetical protein